MENKTGNYFGSSISTSEIDDLAITTAKLNDGAVTIGKLDTAASNALSSPIGSVIGWLKSFTNTPALPTGWVECNGQVLSDAGSVYNGQTIPSLNTTNNFLRGDSTSGSTGGSATISGIVNDSQRVASGSSCISATAVNGTNTLPPYYTVVWVMRVK